MGGRKWVPIFREKLEFVDFPDSERRKMVAKASPLWEEWAREMDEKGFPGTEMLAYTMALVAEHSP